MLYSVQQTFDETQNGCHESSVTVRRLEATSVASLITLKTGLKYSYLRTTRIL